MQTPYVIDNSLGYLTGRYSRLILKRVANAFAENSLDITADQWTVLVRLWAQGGMTQTVISDLIAKDKSRTTRIISSLEASALLRRVSSKDDNREKLVYLTDKGKELMNSATRVVQETLEESYKGIDADKLTVCREVLRQAFSNLR